MTNVQKIQQSLQSHKIDSLLVSNFYNILYLSSFKGLSPEEREAWMLITKRGTYFFTDGRYAGQVQNSKFKIQNLEYKIISHEKKLTDYLKEIIEKEDVKTLGFEAEDLKYKEHEQFRKKLGVSLVPTEKIISNARSIKDKTEIELIKKACNLTDRCLKEIVKAIKIGQTEAEIAFKIELWIKERGHDLAFYPIVAVDENSAIPHYDTRGNGKKKIKKGSVVLIDFGINYRNYRSDITRMVFVGRPSDEVVRIYNILLNSQQNGLKALSETSSAKDIDLSCRKLITTMLELEIPHSIGHGVGLEIHEEPKLSIISKDLLQKDNVFTVEPGVYIPGKFGMRIEDTVWMKEEKKPEILTRFPKELRVI